MIGRMSTARSSLIACLLIFCRGRRRRAPSSRLPLSVMLAFSWLVPSSRRAPFLRPVPSSPAADATVTSPGIVASVKTTTSAASTSSAVSWSVGDRLHAGKIADRAVDDVAFTVDDDEHPSRAVERVERGEGGLGLRRLDRPAVDQAYRRPNGPGPRARSAAPAGPSCGASAARSRRGFGPEGDAAAGVVRGADRALAGVASPLLAVRLRRARRAPRRGSWCSGCPARRERAGR